MVNSDFPFHSRSRGPGSQKGKPGARNQGQKVCVTAITDGSAKGTSV